MPTEWTDEALMIAAKGGDVDKLGPLFDRYSGRLFDFFSRMNGSRTGSHDLVQEVFSRMLQYRSTFRHDSVFVSWMYKIARNVRFQYFKVHGKTNTVPSMDLSLVDARLLPDVVIEKRQQAEAVKRALMSLAEDRRELLILVWYQELKYEQIAELLEIEVGAVKVRVHRALKELREIYLKQKNGKTPCSVN